MSDPSSRQPVELADFTAEVAQATGEKADALSRRPGVEAIDPLLARAEAAEPLQHQDSLAERIEQLPEGLRDIADQYQEQFSALTFAKLMDMDPSSGEFGCTTIEGAFAKFPSLSEVVDRILDDAEGYAAKVDQGFNRLLLVPFGMRLDQLQDGYDHVLAEQLKTKGHVVAGGSQLVTMRTSHLAPAADTQIEPLERVQGYRYVSFHREETKDGLLQGDPDMAWRVFLVEDPTECDLVDLPVRSNTAHQRVDAGRGRLYPFRDAKTTPQELQKELNEAVFRGEQGMDRETYYTLALQELRRTGQVLDCFSKTVLLGTYEDFNDSMQISRYYPTASFESNPGFIVYQSHLDDDRLEAGLRTVVEVT